MTGGHYDSRRSRLKSVQLLRESGQLKRQLEQQLSSCREAMQEADQQVAAALGEMEQVELEHRRILAQANQARDDTRTLKADLSAKQAALNQKVGGGKGKGRVSWEEVWRKGAGEEGRNGSMIWACTK